MSQVEYVTLGDSAVLIKINERDEERARQKIGSIVEKIESDPFPGFIECAFGYYSVAVYYDPAKVFQFNDPHVVPFDVVLKNIKAIVNKGMDTHISNPRTVIIPVCYGNDFGPDLEFVARHNDISSDEVIQLHVQQKYVVRMIGFAPGFPYLEGLNPRLSTPRKSSPRLVIPSGSVGIGGNQTGIYPLESPGGWQLIGRSPLRLFKPELSPPSLLQAGDLVQFQPISVEQYNRLSLKERGT